MCSSSRTRQNEQNPATGASGSAEDVDEAHVGRCRARASYISRVHGLVNDASSIASTASRSARPASGSTTGVCDDVGSRGVPLATRARRPGAGRRGVAAGAAEPAPPAAAVHWAESRPGRRQPRRAAAPARRGPSRAAIAHGAVAGDGHAPVYATRRHPAHTRRASPPRAAATGASRPEGQRRTRHRVGVRRRRGRRTPRRAAHPSRRRSAAGLPAMAAKVDRASASSAEMPTTGLSMAKASPCMVAMPMRSPVNEPGPDGHGKQIDVGQARRPRRRARVRARRAGARRACASRRQRRRPATWPSRTSATLPARVVVSSASISMGDGLLRHRILDLARSSNIQPCPSPPALRRLARAGRHRPDAGDAAVPRREAAVPRRDRVLPHGRLLRDVLRGRAGGRARARPDADVALEGRHRAARSRCAACRTTPPTATSRAWCKKGFRVAICEQVEDPKQGQGPRQARGRARRVARHADRRAATSTRASPRS